MLNLEFTTPNPLSQLIMTQHQRVVVCLAGTSTIGLTLTHERLAYKLTLRYKL